jgi:hypothetical protein
MTATQLSPVPGPATPGAERPQGRHPLTRRARRRRRNRSWILIVSIMCILSGLSMVGGSVVAPEAVDKVTGNAKVAIKKQVQAVVAPDELPEITLGPEGGIRDLDQCDGTFTEMISYRTADVLPLYAAHNKCGGDIILGWELGDRIRVAGSDVVYEVVEERHTPKWSRVDTLRGMTGEFMVQTCFYGEPRMRFLALAPVTAASVGDG